MTDAPVLELDDLVLDYPLKRESLFAAPRSLRAVDGVSFAIPRGRALGLVGESGCGKTSVAKTVMGLEQPTAGHIRILGRDIAAMPRGELLGFRRHFQMVFQDPYGSLDPRHTIGRIVAEPMRTSMAKARKPVGDALEAVGLSAGDAKKYPHQFSGGQRQRISIARAIAPRPRILIADEPVSALDVTIRAQVLALLTEIAARDDLTLIFVSHDLAVVRQVCERVAVLRAGRVVETGPTEVVYRQPAAEYTRELLAAVPTLQRSLAAARERVRGDLSGPGG